jgi:hypothetical protein
MVSVQCEDQAARQHEEGVVEALVVTGQSGNILVDEGVGIQQPPVPRPAGIQGGDGEGDVVDGGNYGHARLLVSWPRRQQSFSGYTCFAYASIVAALSTFRAPEGNASSRRPTASAKVGGTRPPSWPVVDQRPSCSTSAPAPNQSGEQLLDQEREAVGVGGKEVLNRRRERLRAQACPGQADGGLFAKPR